MKSTKAQERLRILSDEEIEMLFGKPNFTQEERTELFSLSPVENNILEQFHSVKSRICFILNLGYFKARQLFFTFDFQQTQDDAYYIQKQYFPDFQLADLNITKVTRLKQHRLILELLITKAVVLKLANT